ncbi:MAG: DUF58 domain-containing protein [Candidatus Stygibacter australis]|nr:DUF58 domain-containing protein [Candidatus Stygibacter australis]MDP8320727.1 DUF58 domain-containing protein [Candidatus Stygibacter australis]
MEVSEIIAKIKKIEITTRNLVSELFSGEYHSMFKGQGLEFSEVREYQDGDSFRQIDWNVSARMGHPYIKKFEETRELNVIFLIDVSGSTSTGTHSYLKSEYITEITAVLSFSALSNNDKVGLLLFSDQIEKYSPPRKGKKSALRILRDILYHVPQSDGTDLKAAIEYAYQIIPKRSIIFIISDFLADDYKDSLRILAGKHDVIALRILDKADLELPKCGLLNVADPETGRRFTINTGNRKLREKYKKATDQESFEFNETMKKIKVENRTFTTDESYTKKLMELFRARKHRR